MISRTLKLAGLLALSACTTSPHSLVIVHVNAETGVQTASGSYVLRVEGRAPGGEFVEEHLETYQGWGRDFTLGPREHDASRSYRVTLIAYQGRNGVNLDGTGEVARNVLISGYVQSQTRQYDLILYDNCVGVECGENEACDIAGNCLPAEIPPSNLPLVDAGTGEDGAVLPDAPGIDGAVVPDANEFPDGGPGVDGGPRDAGGPEVDGGPGDAGPSDAGSDVEPTDAGPVDAGMDAGPVDAGMDAGPMDAGMDAGPVDAGMDAGPVDAGMDAGPVDAGMDAGPMDAGMDAGPDGGPVVVEAGMP